jgi:hypothetical protein
MVPTRCSLGLIAECAPPAEIERAGQAVHRWMGPSPSTASVLKGG